MADNQLLQCKDGARSEILASFNETEESLAVAVASLKTWLEKQPHLPHDVSDRKLAAFVVLNKFRIEKAKLKLDTYFTVRSLLPEYFNITYATSPEMQRAYETAIVVPLPIQYNNTRIFAATVTDDIADHFDPVHAHACAFHIMDIILEEDNSAKSVIVADCQNIGFAHAMKVDFVVQRNLKIVMEGVFSGRVEAIHLVNLNPICNAALNLARTIFKEKIASRIYGHKSFDSVYEIIPKEVLPSDFGGHLKPLEEIRDEWAKKMIEYEPYYQKMMAHKMDELVRPKELISELFEDLQGNFRKLEVD